MLIMPYRDLVRLDPRLTPARPDLAADSLRGQVQAARFVEGIAYQVSAGVAPVRKAPAPDAEQLAQALFGEQVTIYEEHGGFGWGQALRDGYVGWFDMEGLSAPVLTSNAKVVALRTYVYPEPSLKSAPRFLLSLGAEVHTSGREGNWVACERAGYVYHAHLAPLEAIEPDWVGVAERFVGAPYQWGGEESLGLDCSALIQIALRAGGFDAPRDSDMQQAALGRPLAVGPDLAGLQRGDLVFWKGHVGVMLDGENLLHANAFHMCVAREPLRSAVERIAAAYGPMTICKRLTP